MNHPPFRLLLSNVFALALAAALTALTCAEVGAQCPTAELASGLEFPSGVIQTPLGNLLIAENGAAAPNTGRISIVGLDGNRRTLLGGLPSGNNEVVGPAGPSGLFMRGRTLYAAIGLGDATQAGPVPGTEVANPNPSSPLFASLLAIKFSAATERSTQGFTLTVADHQALADGQELQFGGGRDKVVVKLIADFPDFTPDPLPFFPDNVRHSNPYHLLAIGNRLYVTESGMNSVVQVEINSGASSTVASFDPFPNPLPFGPPDVEAVPTGLAVSGDQLLVTLFTGFPFPPGTSEVRAVDLKTGEQTPFFGGLSTAVDVLPISRQGDTDYLVLEFSADLLANLPGRLLRFETPGGTPTVVADCLITPSAMTYDRQTRTLFVTEAVAGRLLTVAVE